MGKQASLIGCVPVLCQTRLTLLTCLTHLLSQYFLRSALRWRRLQCFLHRLHLYTKSAPVAFAQRIKCATVMVKRFGIGSRRRWFAWACSGRCGWNGGRNRRLSCFRGQQRVEQTLDVGAHDDAISGGSDEALQLRQLSAFGADKAARRTAACHRLESPTGFP